MMIVLELRRRAFRTSLTKMTRGKPESPKNHIFFEGVPF